MSRTKKVFPSEQVAHEFAHAPETGRTEARNARGNFYYDSGYPGSSSEPHFSLWSYGSHFCVAAHHTAPDGKPATLITSRGYSNTTSRHKYHAWRACSHLRTFTVHNPRAVSKREHKENLNEIRENYHALVLRASRARTNAEFLLERAEETREHGNAYAACFRLGVRIKPANVAQIKERAKKEAAKHARERKAAEAARLEREKEARAEYLERLELWKRGELDKHRLGYHRPAGVGIALRLKPSEPETVQTSEGAEFPTADARRLWPLILRSHRTGRGACIDTGDASLGSFRVDHIQSGNVRAGCHLVTFEACEELARVLGLV